MSLIDKKNTLELVVVLALILAISILAILMITLRIIINYKRKYEQKSEKALEKAAQLQRRIERINRELELFKSEREALIDQINDLKPIFEENLDLVAENINREIDEEKQDGVLSALRQENATLKKTINEMQIEAQMITIRDTTTDGPRPAAELERELIKAKILIKNIESQIKTLSKLIGQKNSEIAVLRTRNGALLNRNGELSKEKARLEKTLKEIDNVLKEIQLKHTEVQEIRAALELELSHYKGMIIEKDIRINSLKLMLEDEKNDNNKNQNEIIQQDKNLHALNEENNALKQKNSSVESAFELVSNEQDRLVKQNLDLQLEISHLRQQIPIRTQTHSVTTEAPEESLLNEKPSESFENLTLTVEIEEYKPSTLNKAKERFRNLFN